MAAAKRYSVEQIVAKLREMEKLQAQGVSIPAACKRLGFSDQTFYRRRQKYGVYETHCRTSRTHRHRTVFVKAWV